MYVIISYLPNNSFEYLCRSGWKKCELDDKSILHFQSKEIAIDFINELKAKPYTKNKKYVKIETLPL